MKREKSKDNKSETSLTSSTEIIHTLKPNDE